MTLNTGSKDAIDSSASATLRCPACQSWSTATTAKFPDAESYWRCTKCGEVWNAARARYTERPWRR